MKIFLLILFYFTFGCQPSGKNEGQSVSIEAIATKKYSSNIYYLENKNKTYTICFSQKEKTDLKPYPPLKFFVFDNNKNKVIYEDNLANGTVKWIGKYKFEVVLIPGIVSIDKEKDVNKYVYDVKIKKKI